MAQTRRPRNRRDSTASLRTPAESSRPGAVRRFRFDRTFGFWLGGLILGTVGRLIGGNVPYDHPVAVTTSALWWGLCGSCLGASVGALLGFWAKRTAASPPRGSPRGEESPALADGIDKPRLHSCPKRNNSFPR
jgi:hypothetical protein